MSDDAQYDNEIDDPGDESEGLRGLRKAKNAAEARQRELEAELAQAGQDRKELAFLKADLGQSKAVDFFRLHYDGPLDADSIRSGASDAGVLPDTDPAAQAALEGQQRMSNAFAGGEPTSGSITHIGPYREEVPVEETEMWEKFEAAVKGQGGAQAGAEVLRAYGRNVGAASEPIPGGGNPTVVPISHPGYTGTPPT